MFEENTVDARRIFEPCSELVEDSPRSASTNMPINRFVLPIRVIVHILLLIQSYSSEDRHASTLSSRLRGRHRRSRYRSPRCAKDPSPNHSNSERNVG